MELLDHLFMGSCTKRKELAVQDCDNMVFHRIICPYSELVWGCYYHLCRSVVLCWGGGFPPPPPLLFFI